jgi:hypothetical protein
MRKLKMREEGGHKRIWGIFSFPKEKIFINFIAK